MVKPNDFSSSFNTLMVVRLAFRKLGQLLLRLQAHRCGHGSAVRVSWVHINPISARINAGKLAGAGWAFPRDGEAVLPDRFTVIDVMDFRALGAHEGTPLSVPLNLRYLAFCGQQAERLGISLRDMDPALWQWGHDHPSKERPSR